MNKILQLYRIERCFLKSIGFSIYFFSISCFVTYLFIDNVLLLLLA